MKRELLLFRVFAIALFLFAYLSWALPSQAQQTTTPTVNYVPFEINDDNSAIFRFYASDAKSVTLGGDLKGIKSEKSNDGIWTITTAPHLNPSAYRYFFMVDGMKVNDPKNPMVADFRPMVELVPKSQTLFWQQKDVPHGLLSIVTDWYYEPEALGRFVKAYNYTEGKLEPAPNIFSEGTISKQQTYCEGAIGLNGPIEDYAKFCQMLLNGGEFNGYRILKRETIDLMTKINRLPEVNSGGKGFQFGLGFELYNEYKKPVPEVSNTAFAWGGLYGTEYIVDPENDMIVLFYLNMPKRERLYPLFLSKAYRIFGK